VRKNKSLTQQQLVTPEIQPPLGEASLTFLIVTSLIPRCCINYKVLYHTLRLIAITSKVFPQNFFKQAVRFSVFLRHRQKPWKNANLS
jgi:hypothetical protein